MKMEAKDFIASRYTYNSAKNRAVFYYQITFKNAPKLSFKEVVVFPKKPAKNASKELLGRSLDALHLALGLSYYKTYIPKNYKHPYRLTGDQAEFWNSVYQKGLGEFYYQNNINPKTIQPFVGRSKKGSAKIAHKPKKRALVGVGGGKDSTVSIELLKKEKHDITAFIVETNRPDHHAREMVQRYKVPSLIIRRNIDKKLLGDLPGSYNGHIPISAIWAFIGYTAAILYDYQDIITSNESSSNVGSLTYKGLEINHQWSKSQEFEDLFKKYVSDNLTNQIRYFSLLRPFTELRIVSEFVRYPKYLKRFTSCNKNFAITKKTKTLWCNECPKCAFTFTLLAAFLPKKTVLGIFKEDLFNKEELEQTFKDLAGFGDKKPFDCVGTFEEVKAALYKARKNFKSSKAVKSLVPKIKNGEKLYEEVMKTSPARNIPAEYIFSGVRSVILIGYGLEGKTTEKWLKKTYPKIVVTKTDQKNGKDYLSRQTEADLAIKTPGIPKEKIKVHYTTATNIFLAKKRDQVIGITGTAGKSTTATMLASVLKAAKKDVRLIGNIGNPMIDELQKPATKNTLYVTELSSYQLDDATTSPHIAIVTNLFDDHMNYHGSVAKYHKAKSNILRNQHAGDIFIYEEKKRDIPKGYIQIKTWRTLLTTKNLRDLRDYNQEKAKTEILAVPKYNKDTTKYYLKIHHDPATYASGVQAGMSIPIDEALKVCVTAGKILGLDDATIKKGFLSFKGLEHRLKKLGYYNDILFIDDAIATTPESTILAINMFKSNLETIFLGGEDRGYDFKNLETVIKNSKIKNIILFPDSGKRMNFSKKDFNILETKKMKDAVAFALKNTNRGGIVLLSTASPSFSLWKDYKEKGKDYYQWIKRLTRKNK